MEGVALTPAAVAVPDGCEVFLVRAPRTSAACAALARQVTEPERQRAARLRRRRATFLAARVTLRRLLAQKLGCDPLEVPIVVARLGKPLLGGPAAGAFWFNTSHSGDLAAIAIAREREVGIDLELRRDRARLSLLIPAILSADEEVAWWAQAPGRDEFFDLWCAKEACAKLVGRGLAMPLDAIALASPCSAVSAARIRYRDSDVSAVVQRLPLLAGASAALAVEAP